jgi:hypothetical protein
MTSFGGFSVTLVDELYSYWTFRGEKNLVVGSSLTAVVAVGEGVAELMLLQRFWKERHLHIAEN